MINNNENESKFKGRLTQAELKEIIESLSLALSQTGTSTEASVESINRVKNHGQNLLNIRNR